MREYHFLLKNVNKYYRFEAINNNDAIKHLYALGTSYSSGILCEMSHAHPRDIRFVQDSSQIASEEVVRFSKKNVERGHSGYLAPSSWTSKTLNTI